MVEKKVEKTEKTKKAQKVAKTLPELQKELLEARRGLVDGTLQNLHKIKTLKKAIARSKTLTNQGKGA